MPAAPGWAYRSQSAVASGTTSLTIAAPAGIVDDDILILSIVHEGAGFATLPAGFTVIEQDIAGATRVELAWKRASSESGSYSVTGLATRARGGIVCYEGGLETGDIVEASSVEAVTGGQLQIADGRAPTITPTSEGALMIFVCGADANSTLTKFGCQNDLAEAGGSFAIDWTSEVSDPDLRSVRPLFNSGATGIRHIMGDALKLIPNRPTGWMYAQLSGTPASVCIMAALTPRTTALAGDETHYYLTFKAPPVHQTVPYQAGWHSSMIDAAAHSIGNQRTELLDQRRSGGGILIEHGYVTDQNARYNVVLKRWMTPELEEQTISGTIDLRWPIAAWWQNDVGTHQDLADVRTRLHIYVSKGQTGESRGVLLGRHVDSVSWPYDTVAVAGLAAPVALTPVTCEAGDTICVELGFQVVDSPDPDPPPPAELTQVAFSLGTSNNQAGGALEQHVGVPYLDATIGVAGASQCPYLIFSDTIRERESSHAIPDNTTWQTATLLTDADIPYTSPTVDSTRVPEHLRRLWWEFTPEESGRYILTVNGSNHYSGVGVLQDYEEDPTRPSFSDFPVAESNIFLNTSFATHTIAQDLVGDTRYWIFIQSNGAQYTAARTGGGATRLVVTRQASPEEDDILYGGSQTLLMDPCGIVKAFQSSLESFSPSGLAVDYSRRPMADLTSDDWPALDNENIRVHIAVHGTQLITIVDVDDLNMGEAEVDGIGTFPEEIESHLNHLAIADDGREVVGRFGSGYYLITGDGFGLIWGGSGNAILSSLSDEDLSDAYVIEVDAVDSAANQPVGPIAAVTHATPAEVAAASCVALAPDGRTLFYTSPAWYTAVTREQGATVDLRATRIMRWDLDDQVELPDIAVIEPEPGAVSTLKGLAVLPEDKGVLVCAGHRVFWLSLEGELLRRYDPTPQHGATDLCSVALTSDVRTFWVMDHQSSYLFLFDLFSGAQLRRLEVNLASGTGSQIAVYTPNGLNLCW